MNRGFKKYFKEGMFHSSKTLKGKGNLLRYYLYFTLCAVSVICPFLLPIFNMGYFRLAKQAKYDHDIEVCKLIKSGDSFKNYWTTILVGILKFLLFIAMIILIAFFIGGSLLVGYAVFLFTEGASSIIPIAFAVPAAILLVVFLLVYPFATVPEAFLVDNTNGENASKVLFDSLHALKRTGKRTLFATYLVQSLITTGILAVAFGVCLLVTSLLKGAIGLGIAMVVCIGVILTLIRVLPIFELGFNIARFSLFEDLTTDKYKASQRIKGVNIDEVQPIKVEERLVALFEHNDIRKVKYAETINEVEEIKPVSKKQEKVKVEKPTKVEEQPVAEVPTVSEEIAEEPVVEAAPVEDAPVVITDEPIAEAGSNEESTVEETPVVEEVVAEETPVTTDEPVEEVATVSEEIAEEPVVEEQPVVEVRNHQWKNTLQ